MWKASHGVQLWFQPKGELVKTKALGHQSIIFNEGGRPCKSSTWCLLATRFGLGVRRFKLKQIKKPVLLMEGFPSKSDEPHQRGGTSLFLLSSGFPVGSIFGFKRNQPPTQAN